MFDVTTMVSLTVLVPGVGSLVGCLLGYMLGDRVRREGCELGAVGMADGIVGLVDGAADGLVDGAVGIADGLAEGCEVAIDGCPVGDNDGGVGDAVGERLEHAAISSLSRPVYVLP